MDWGALDGRARRLEASIDAQISGLSEIGKGASTEVAFSRADGQIESLTSQLEQALSELADVNARMSAMADATSASVSRRHTLQRHREILPGLQRDFQNTVRRIRDSRNKAELLTSVQRDINTYRSAEAQRQDAYLKEQQSIHNSMRGAEDAISIAIAAKEALVAQRGFIAGATDRLGDVIQKFPALNNLMKKINYRKSRDQVIMAGVISTCIIFILWYMIR